MAKKPSPAHKSLLAAVRKLKRAGLTQRQITNIYITILLQEYEMVDKQAKEIFAELSRRRKEDVKYLKALLKRLDDDNDDRSETGVKA